jgi:hypothetical protein
MSLGLEWRWLWGVCVCVCACGCTQQLGNAIAYHTHYTHHAGKPVLFTGEMVFRWMFEDFAALRPFKAAADLLAAKADWPALYRPGVRVCYCWWVCWHLSSFGHSAGECQGWSCDPPCCCCLRCCCVV